MNQTVLVVAEEASVLQSIRRHLASEPYELHLVSGIEEGLKALETVCASLIVADMHMPQMNGVAFLEQASATCPRAVRMVLSRREDVGSIQEAIDRGHVWRHVAKPWLAEDLKLAVRNGLDLWRSEAERHSLLEELRKKTPQPAEMNAALEAQDPGWQLREQRDILHMILDEKPIDTVLARGVEAIGQILQASAVSLRAAFEDRHSGAAPDAAARTAGDRCRETGRPASESGWLALPLAKDGTHLGELIVPQPASKEARSAVKSMAPILAAGLSQQKTLAESPALMGGMDRLVYVGDLSAEDAAVIVSYARQAHRILEFGVGGSTQLFAQHASSGVSIVSLDTSQRWIDETEANLKSLGCPGRVQFQICSAARIEGTFDLIFDDGKADKRASFARDSWNLLEPGGVLMVHDTRRAGEIAWLSEFIREYWLEISNVAVNESDSNITVISKCEKRWKYNWNRGVAEWRVNGNGKPADWVDILRNE